MALYRPDIPSMSLGANPHEGIVSPARTAATVSDLASDLRHLSVSSRAHSVAPAMHNTLFSPPTRSQISTPFQLQPTYGMMPVVYHGVPVTPPYMLDPVQSRSHNAIIPPSNYSLVSPMMSPSASFASSDYMTPRNFQSLARADSRRNNAMRVSRTSQYYNPNTHHNHVDVGRIREGTDVRTTVSDQLYTFRE